MRQTSRQTEAPRWLRDLPDTEGRKETSRDGGYKSPIRHGMQKPEVTRQLSIPNTDRKGF